ncbi:hypothetical protein GNP44_11920 [Aliivibrio fischeri]|uniref:hypothetical protein n=1 Tax=Aliivibrio fischeri TaxID=668 RepID=UPI00084C249E|nr:hypothetical protein [Aliivibrio fischeri]MUK30779.1 hypothetical protein [Aliivibrio fischeri]OED51204.1 hypothetical protein BEI46_06985 [Aliivibrio fischeri]
MKKSFIIATILVLSSGNAFARCSDYLRWVEDAERQLLQTKHSLEDAIQRVNNAAQIGNKFQYDQAYYQYEQEKQQYEQDVNHYNSQVNHYNSNCAY